MSGWWVASYVVLWLLVATLAVVVVALARQIGTLHLRLGPRGALEIDDEGPALGDALPPHELGDIDDRPVTVGGPGRAQLLLFVSPGCHVCEQVLPSLHAIGRDLTPLVLSDVDAHETARAYAGRDLQARVVPARDVVASYDIPGTPFVIVLDDAGIVRAKGTVNNLEQLEGLIDSARRRISTSPQEGQAGRVSTELRFPQPDTHSSQDRAI